MTAACGTPTTPATNGGRPRTCLFPSSTTSAWTWTGRTTCTADYRTTVRGWASRSTRAASPTVAGKTCTAATVSGCSSIPPIPITSTRNPRGRNWAGESQDARDPQRQAAPPLPRGQAALQLEHAHSRERHPQGHDLHRRAILVSLARLRADVGSDLTRPHHQ